MTRLLLITVTLFASAALALAQPSKTSALINEELDKQDNFELAGTLPQAIKKITAQDGTAIDALLPRRVPGLAGIRHIAAGSYHSCALAMDGAVGRVA